MADFAKKLTQERVHKFAIRAIKRYGTYTIENRAVPDFRCGLKPVQIRTLWAMHTLGLRANGGTKKTARVVGDVIGKYHPHGDAPVHEAMVTMVNSPLPTITGQGNWGYMNTRAADMRYSEAKLSAYADKMFFDPMYMPVVKFIPNYDGEDIEPIFLPSLLPNILLNGCAGIAVGMVSCIPPFKVKGVKKLITKALEGNKITPKDCLHHLEVNYQYGGKVLSSNEEMLKFYTTGAARLNIGCEYTIEGNSALIHSFPPHFNMDKATEKMLEEDDVASASEESYLAKKEDKNGERLKCPRFRINFRSDVEMQNRPAVAAKCIAKLNSGLNLQIAIIERHNAKRVDLIDGLSMPELIHKWVDWRIGLEVDAQKYVKQKIEKEIAHQKLLILTIDHLDIIFKLLKEKKPDLEGRIATALKVNAEQAKTIVGIAVGRLSALAKSEILEVIAKKEAAIKEVERYIKRPQEKILADLQKIKLEDVDHG